MRACLPLVVGDVARFVRCGVGRLFRRQPRADEAAWASADGWDNTTVASRPPVTVPYLLPRACMPFECGRFGPWLRVRPPW